MKNLQPQGLWSNFYDLTQIPRPSGQKEEVSAFLANYGRSLGLETIVDAIGNVIIRKPASPGYENHSGVILQGHMDMVPQKNNDTVFDFESDPIEAYVDGGNLLNQKIYDFAHYYNRGVGFMLGVKMDF